MSEYLVERSFPSRRPAPDGSSPLAVLSQRERHILRLIAESKTSKEIAETLGLNYRTVENQRAAISQKLGLQGSHALVKFAFEHKTELLDRADPHASRAFPEVFRAFVQPAFDGP